MDRSSRLHVGIVTISEDLHSDIVSAELRGRGHDVSVVLNDCLPGYGGLSWGSDRSAPALLRTAAGSRVAPGDLDVVWWRRAGVPRVPDRVVDPQAREYVEAAGAAAAFGLWLMEVRGRWVSGPEATRRAENKIVQLQAAVDAGLTVPRTLISQHPEDIRRFAASLGPGRMIAKPVTSVRNVGLATGVVSADMLQDDVALALAPTVYQELIPGSTHLRVCCFGSRVIAARIYARELDWRYERDYRVEACRTDDELDAALLDVLHRLDLRMGVFDLKLGSDGQPIWLEVNPQGQFLFVEARGGPPLAGAMAEFLLEEGHAPSG